MNPQDAVDLSREAIVIATLIAAPVLVAGMVIGLVVGLIQALTQIQEQTVAFVPKLIAMVLAAVATGRVFPRAYHQYPRHSVTAPVAQTILSVDFSGGDD